MSCLLIVESPTKARTIRGLLKGKEYRVEASMGHIRDLPSKAAEIPTKYRGESWARMGVRTENGFEPLYIVPADKKKVVKQLRSALADASEVLIATDEDREGESIGWHLMEVLKPKVPVRRMVFHEITKAAIWHALENTRGINQRLVDAQETRRVLDRLVGYEISPILWKKIAPRLAAGRVQSVSVRLLVEKERERIAFKAGSYWGLTAELKKEDAVFNAVLTHIEDLRVAVGRDFDDNTGRLKDGLEAGKNIMLLDKVEAQRLERELVGAPWCVLEVTEKEKRRNPAPPFITSTLQQEAGRKLRMSAKQTMSTAQKLYQNGHITYMRTDSVQLSDEAMQACRRAITDLYGSQYLSGKPRVFSRKVRNAQEAHEAIRPAGAAMRRANELGLSGDQARLYKLIWKRTIATQMAQCRELHRVAIVETGTEESRRATFRAAGKDVLFDGFVRAYVEGTDDNKRSSNGSASTLPPLAEGDEPDCCSVVAQGHETRPPARYTEATLIKKLEQEGIGRPSTYATIISTIQDRGSARRIRSQLVPTFTAFATTQLLEQQFANLVDTGFTATMEQDLDAIAEGEKGCTEFLRNFYKGEGGLEEAALHALDELDAKQISTMSFPNWGPYVVRVGRYGPYVEGDMEGLTRRASLPDDVTPDDLSEEVLLSLLEQAQSGGEVLGKLDGAPVYFRTGRYGPYVQHGDGGSGAKPKRSSLPKGMETVSFDQAVRLLSLPRTIGMHPDTGDPVLAGYGRYGPYVSHQGVYASLSDADDVFTIDLPRGLELLAKKATSQRVLGEHPKGGLITVRKGRYGPYVKHKRSNASLTKQQSIETITLDEALALLAAKAKAQGTKTVKRRAKGRRT